MNYKYSCFFCRLFFQEQEVAILSHVFISHDVPKMQLRQWFAIPLWLSAGTQKTWNFGNKVADRLYALKTIPLTLFSEYCRSGRWSWEIQWQKWNSWNSSNYVVNDTERCSSLRSSHTIFDTVITVSATLGPEWTIISEHYLNDCTGKWPTGEIWKNNFFLKIWK